MGSKVSEVRSALYKICTSYTNLRIITPYKITACRKMAEGCRERVRQYKIDDEGVPTSTTKEQARTCKSMLQTVNNLQGEAHEFHCTLHLVFTCRHSSREAWWLYMIGGEMWRSERSEFLCDTAHTFLASIISLVPILT